MSQSLGMKNEGEDERMRLVGSLRLLNRFHVSRGEAETT